MKILYNGQIYTLNPSQPVVSAIAIENGRILAAGSDDEITAISPKCEKMDLAGQTVLPGLIDAHLHLKHYAQSLEYVNCETDTKAECLARVAERAKNAPKGSWILGHGWNQNVWAEGFGDCADLDQVAEGHPVYLTAKSLHAAWANSAALKLAGITSTSPNPVGGEYQRNSAGNITGMLLESAMEDVHKIIPKPSQKDITDSIERAQKTLWQMGLTGVHDYDGPDCFTALQELFNAGRLKLRVHKGIPFENFGDAISLGLRSGFGNDFLRLGSIKLFADGALGPQTAAMLQPYEGSSQQTGSLFLDREQVFEIGQRASANGFSIAIHAIGDRANHEMLEGYAALRRFEQENGLPARRHRIEHVQLLHPDDYSRLAALDIIASVQPIHATSDMIIADHFWGSRSAGAYAIQTLLKNKTRLAFGSDAPVESPNPFLGIHAAVTRRRPDGSPSIEGWYPEQKISLADAISGFTTGPAYAAGNENIQGRLAPGFYADLIVLKQDPFMFDSMELFHTRPEATMVNGEWVFTL